MSAGEKLCTPHGILSARIEDITTLACGAIVNAANEKLLGGGGVDGAIHRAAGPGLLEECRAIGGCPTGEARITDGHALPARHVIHTVGPVWSGGEAGEPALLASCYRTVLELAAAHDIADLAFPAISCGIYGYPVDEATDVAVREVIDGLARHDGVHSVTFACFSEDVLEAYRAAFEVARR